VITEDDLRSGGRPTRGTVSVGTPDAPADSAEKPSEAKEGAEGAQPASAASPEPSESDKREARQKEIQAEIDYQSANIKTLQEQINTAQTELNDLTDMTFSAEGTGSGRRAALMKLIDDANAQIKASRDAIAGLEDQARQAGVRVNIP
jgi:chromosome segregation ATPase